MVEALRSEGATVIYTTHYMEEAERLCDRIAIVDHGRVIALAARGASVILGEIAQIASGNKGLSMCFLGESPKTLLLPRAPR